jgi:hypothetical protein
LDTNEIREKTNEFWNQDNMGYHGDLTKDWIPVYSKNRDSAILEESNFDQYIQELIESDYEKGEYWTVETFNHWAVGHVTYIFVRAFDDSSNLTPVMGDVVFKLSEALEHYPILDEEDVSEREYNAQMEYIENARTGDYDASTVYDLINNLAPDELLESRHEGYVPDCLIREAVQYLDILNGEFVPTHIYTNPHGIGGYEIQIGPYGMKARYRHTKDMKVSDWKPLERGRVQLDDRSVKRTDLSSGYIIDVYEKEFDFDYHNKRA